MASHAALTPGWMAGELRVQQGRTMQLLARGEPCAAVLDRRPALSVILPLYDEATRLTRTLAELRKALDAGTHDYEILAVDDGSRDATPRLLGAEARRDPALRVLRLARNRGKGAAVRAGALAARGERVLFLDADLSTDLEALPRLVALLDSGADVVFGSRRVAGAAVAARQPAAREFAGRVFSRLARRIADPAVSDFTCGFKGFRREAARSLFGQARIDRWAFDAELAALARRQGLALVCLPVRWSQRGSSKVRVPGAALGALRDLARIAWRMRRRGAHAS